MGPQATIDAMNKIIKNTIVIKNIFLSLQFLSQIFLSIHYKSWW